MRIAVADVLGWLAAGMTHEEIISDYPELTEDDIRACLAYAEDQNDASRSDVLNLARPFKGNNIQDSSRLRAFVWIKFVFVFVRGRGFDI